MNTYKFTIEINGLQMKTSVLAYSENEAKGKLWEIIRDSTKLISLEVDEGKKSYTSRMKSLLCI
jgi:hypothetical protein